MFWQCQDDENFFRYKKVNLQSKRARATCFSTFAKQIEASSDDDCNCTPENLTDPLSLSLFLLSFSPLFKIATKSAAASLVDATPYSRHFSLFCFFSFCGETSFCIHWLGSKTQTLTLKIPFVSLSLSSFFFFSFSLSPVLSKIVLTFLSSL